RAIENLLSNAVKYSPEGSTTRITLALNDGAVHCSVIDEGLGIEAAFVADLFKSFARSSNVQAASEHGAGLGLRFVAVVGHRHFVEITVTTTPPQGSTFTLSLPHLPMER